MSSEENKNNKQEEIKRQPEGYVSIIPDTMFDKVLKMSELAEELRKEVYDLNESMMGQYKPDDYQMFQYINFMDFVDTFCKNINLATQIHRLDMEFIDEQAKTRGLTVQQYVTSFMCRSMLKMLKN